MTTPLKEQPTKKTTADKRRAAKKTAPKTATAKKRAPKKTEQRLIGMKKDYLKDKNMCKVTFRLPKVAAYGAKSVCIVGDFNNWGIYTNPMKKLKNGDYTISLELESGREYQFRYLIDENKWENDWNADKYVRNPYGDSDNSVVVV